MVVFSLCEEATFHATDDGFNVTVLNVKISYISMIMRERHGFYVTPDRESELMNTYEELGGRDQQIFDVKEKEQKISVQMKSTEIRGYLMVFSGG